MAVQAKTLFEVIFPHILEEKKTLLPKVNGVVMFTVIGNDGGCWTFDLRKGGDGKVHHGSAKKPDLTIVVADSFLDKFMAGDYDAVKAIKSGQLGILGSEKVFDGFVGMLLGQATKPASKAGKIKDPKKKGFSLR